MCIRSSALAVAGLLFFASAALGAEVVISDDGRQIRLNDDGTWVQVSQDRFATTVAGERVRLRADGTWNLVTQDTAAEAAPMPQAARMRAAAPLQDEAIIYLKSVEILRREIKRAKSKHAETRMRYVVAVDNKTPDTLLLDLEAPFQATTNRGGRYETLSVQGPATVMPGASAELIVMVADSPAWFGVKHMSLEVPVGALGNSVERVLNKSMDEVQRINVDAF